MAIYKVEKRDSSYYVVGLPDESGRYPDTMLLYRYPDGDVDSPYDHDKMLGALYDEYQCHDGLHKGDLFETPFGDFECVGVHVVPVGNKGRYP